MLGLDILQPLTYLVILPPPKPNGQGNPGQSPHSPAIGPNVSTLRPNQGRPARTSLQHTRSIVGTLPELLSRLFNCDQRSPLVPRFNSDLPLRFPRLGNDSSSYHRAANCREILYLCPLIPSRHYTRPPVLSSLTYLSLLCRHWSATATSSPMPTGDY